MKASNYNFFFPYEEDTSKLIAYNSRSNALGLIEKDKHNMLVEFCENGVDIEDDQLIASLRKGLFLLDDDVNELDLIRFNMLNSRYSTTSLSFTIATTSDCNFRCSYCYEKDVIKPKYMSIETEDKIIDLLKSKASSISAFNTTWYGGEPLMGFHTIERLSKAFIAICEENKIEYSANMVTNGYFLTRDKVEKFEEFKISMLQVTLDGMAEMHDRRRPLANGEPTFNVIMNNLKENIDILPHVSLRINVDKNNLESGKNILDYLKEHKMEHRVVPYLGKISNDNNCYTSSECLTMYEFSKEDFNHHLSLQNEVDILNSYPSLASCFCGADSMSSFIIGAEGTLYKCWCDIGDEERSFGNINDNQGVANKALLDYMMYDPTNSGSCSKCKLLPVCMGGCPFRRLANNNDKCSIYKFMLENYLTVITKRLKNSPVRPQHQPSAV
ncbi:radical SAM protein [Paenibacillus sp. GCM10012306]|uniref:radical SAM protein n=1 Tax=Paenibacillus sp. GCM10012306 TaxID=3317342 RepID=UPI00360A39EA